MGDGRFSLGIRLLILTAWHRGIWEGFERLSPFDDLGVCLDLRSYD